MSMIYAPYFLVNDHDNDHVSVSLSHERALSYFFIFRLNKCRGLLDTRGRKKCVCVCVFVCVCVCICGLWRHFD